MATVKTIIPCVCSDGTDNNSVFAGMPQLTVSCGWEEHRQFWSAFCPNCGRGSKLDDHKSPYYALKHWNELQTRLRSTSITWQPEVEDMNAD